MSSPLPTSPKSLQPYVYPVKSLLSRRIKPESEQEALVTSNTRSQVAPPDPDRLPLNPSECGIVHLPPVSPSLSKTRNSSPSDPNHSLASSKMSSYRSNSPSNDLTRMASPTSFSSESLNLALDSQSEAVFEVQSESLTSTSSTDPLVTFRFQHAQDKYGNHVVIGREGKLERCEDEVDICFSIGISNLRTSAADSYTWCSTSFWCPHCGRGIGRCSGCPPGLRCMFFSHTV